MYTCTMKQSKKLACSSLSYGKELKLMAVAVPYVYVQYINMNMNMNQYEHDSRLNGLINKVK